MCVCKYVSCVYVFTQPTSVGDSLSTQLGRLGIQLRGKGLLREHLVDGLHGHVGLLLRRVDVVLARAVPLLQAVQHQLLELAKVHPHRRNGNIVVVLVLMMMAVVLVLAICGFIQGCTDNLGIFVSILIHTKSGHLSAIRAHNSCVVRLHLCLCLCM
jgi:hypothetical protein